MGLTRIKAQQISDIDYKQAVRVITVANVVLSGGAPSTVDGVNLVAGDRILVAGQSTGSQNGLYDVSVLGTGANGTWVRTADGDVTGEIQAGMIVMVTEGTAYRDTQWKLTTNNPIIIGTTSLAFEQNSAYAFGNISANGTAVLANAVGGTVTLTAGDNIAITGNNTTKTVTIGVTGLSLNSISNGSSNVNVVSSGGDVTIGVGGAGNVGVFSPTGLAITGDLSVSGNATLSGNILGDRIVNGTTSIDIQTASGNANISVGGTSNVTVFSTLGQDVTGRLSATGTVTGGNILTAGQVSATGNVTGNYIIGNGSQLTSMTGANVTGTVANATYALSANTASSANVVLDAAQPNITSVGTLTSLTVTGNVVGGNITTAGQISATGNITGGNIITGGGSGGNITGANVITATTLSATGNAIAGNLVTVGQVSAAGNVTGNYIIGNGSQLTGLPASYANSNVAVYLADFGSNSISTSGNVTAGQFTGNGALLTAVTGANVTGTVANATYALSANTASSANVVVDAAQPNITSVGTLTSVSVTGNAVAGNLLTGGVISATGNATAANLLTAGLASATGNITGGNLATAGVITATGTITGGNVVTAGQVSATGNVTANYFLGNGSQLTGITATATEIINGTSNVSINSANANVTITVAGETNSSVFSPGSLFTGIVAVPKTLTGNVVMANNCFGTIINGTVITGNLQIPDGTTVYTWTPS